jgi:DNA modification methylase
MLLCGDCTNADTPARLGLENGVDLVLTDPPYCSGGFQESGRSAGSVGTGAAHKPVAHDRLSTRGYIALVKSALVTVPTPYAYVFTDWRMWTSLFDVVESSGFGVRGMIVWDKGTPGMGKGWRSQHELVMWAAKETAPFDYKNGSGNVLQAPRTGNTLHTTQKPVDLVAKLLEIAEFAATVYDPFAGSGSTLMACVQAGRQARLVEMDAVYCDVICHRYQNHTGDKPTRDGQPHDFTADT